MIYNKLIDDDMGGLTRPTTGSADLVLSQASNNAIVDAGGRSAPYGQFDAVCTMTEGMASLFRLRENELTAASYVELDNALEEKSGHCRQFGGDNIRVIDRRWERRGHSVAPSLQA